MTHRTSLTPIVAALCLLGSACGGSSAGKGSGGNSSGGTSAAGGNSSGGTAAQGGSASGGSSAGGQASGGSVTGGTLSAGGRASGGAAGGASGGSGGTTPAGGTSGGAGGGSTVATGGVAGGATGSACTGTASGTATNTLTVNVDSAQHVIPDPIFGLLMERLGKNWSGGLFVGTDSTIPNTNGMRNDVIAAFKEAGVGMIEWPGGCAAGSYSWSSNKAPSNDVGTDRYMELCALLGIEPYIVGPGTASAATNNSNWVTYINDNAAHPEWHLKYFKVGNEVWGCGGNQTEATYETNYKANYDKLSVPVKDKKLTIIASTGLIGNWTWLDAQLKNQASIIDGIEIHDYIYHPSGSDAPIPNVGFSDAQYYNIVNAANKGQMGPRLDQIISTLDKYDPEKRIKIWEDEWGDWTLPFNNASDGWLQQGTVMDAISAAETLHLFLSHADRIAMAGLAQGINVIHSLLLTRSTDSALVKTPTFYVFKMFLPHHRSNAKWAPNTLKSENITGNGQTFPVLSAGSTVDDQGRINISVANVDLVNTRTIQVTINGGKSAYDVTSAQVITGPAKDSYNDYAKAETVNIQNLAATNCSLSGKTVQITLPSKSVVMLVLTPKGGVTPGTGGAPGTGGTRGAGGSLGAGGASGTGGARGTGGTGGGGSSGTVTDIGGTRAINSLAPDEAKQLCDDTYAYFGSAIPRSTTCKWKGLSYAASSSAPTEEVLKNNCTTQEAACLATDPSTTDHPGCSDLPSTCKATVADYSACITEQVSIFNTKVTGFPACDTLTRDQIDLLFEYMTAAPPPSCDTLSNKCPDLYPPSPLN